MYTTKSIEATMVNKKSHFSFMTVLLFIFLVLFEYVWPMESSMSSFIIFFLKSKDKSKHCTARLCGPRGDRDI